MTIEEGKKVKVEYEGKFDDGTVFDSSKKHGKPLEFEVGKGQVIKGFENAVKGMKKGDEKEVKITPEQGYGDKNPDLKQKIPKDQLPKDKEVKPGMMLIVSSPDGQQMPATILNVDDKEVEIDLNHPLAGKNLNFNLKVIGVE